MYLLDTNVVSELRKGARANSGVVQFFEGLAQEDIHLSVQTIGEIRRGVELIRRRGDLAQAGRLEAWLDELVAGHAARILAFDLDSAQVWGGLLARQSQHPVDKQIAAIGLLYNLTVVTRNTADFAGTGVRLVNPFS